MVAPPVAKLGRSAPEAWPSGEAMATPSASWEAKLSSASR